MNEKRLLPTALLLLVACSSTPEEIEVLATSAGLWVDGQPCRIEQLEDTLMATFQRYQMRIVRVRYAEGAAVDVERIIGAVEFAGSAVGGDGDRALTLETITP